MNENSLTNEPMPQHADEKAILTANSKKNARKVIGIGFGNIFSGKTIELKTKDNFNSSSNINEKLNNNNTKNGHGPIIPPGDKEKPTHSLRKKIKATVLFDYAPTQPDELKLTTGEIIYILDKNLEDEGWWRGESISTGRVGVFPDNFVKEIAEAVSVLGENTPASSVVPVTQANAVSKRKQAIQLQSNSMAATAPANPMNSSNNGTSSATHMM